MRYKIQVIILILIVPVALFFYLISKNDGKVTELFEPWVPQVTVGKVTLRVALALTDEERMRGLSGLPTFPEGRDGMLFVFDKPDIHGIWMKQMRFPIDVIWVSEEKKVMYIIQDLDPSSYPKIYRPPSKARYVIETPANFTKTFPIYVGDEVTIPSL